MISSGENTWRCPRTASPQSISPPIHSISTSSVRFILPFLSFSSTLSSRITLLGISKTIPSVPWRKITWFSSNLSVNWRRKVATLGKSFFSSLLNNTISRPLIEFLFLKDMYHTNLFITQATYGLTLAESNAPNVTTFIWSGVR